MQTTRQTELDPPAADPHPAFTLRFIQRHIGGGEIVGDPETLITGLSSLEAAEAGELAFADDKQKKHVDSARNNRAAAIIVPVNFPPLEGRTLLRIDTPRLAFIKVMHLFQAKPPASTGVHRQALVAPDAELGERVTIREGAIIRSRARIGAETVIESGAHIGEGASIGAQGFIGPNVVIMAGVSIGNRVMIHGGTVVGADGFGYVWDENRYLKIPQLGTVIIEDDVELGANVCVDRATLGATIIKRGTKIDNLVQIAHNDVIGEDVLMSGQVGLAGSVQIGNRVILGGQAGVADHIVVGDGVRVGAASPVIGDVPAGQTVWGFPAREIKKAKQEIAALAFLPDLLKRLRTKAPKK